MQLKGDSTIEIANEEWIIDELSQQGIEVFDRKISGNVLDGSYKVELSINRSAFRKVCSMLVSERQNASCTESNAIDLIMDYRKKLGRRNICILVLIVVLIITIALLFVR